MVAYGVAVRSKIPYLLGMKRCLVLVVGLLLAAPAASAQTVSEL